MAQPVDFTGANVNACPPKGDDRIGHMPVFMNGACVVSCWELDDEDIADIVRSRRVFVGQLSGKHIIPTLVGTAENVRAMCIDFGKTFPKQSEPA